MAQNVYQFNLKGGGTLDFEGDTPPTDEQVEAAARENQVELITANESTAPVNTPPQSVPQPESSVQTQPEPITQPPPQPPPDNRGALRRAWDWASKPLTEIPSRIADTIADTIDQPSLDRSRFGAQVEGFLAGATEGVGDVISGFTSPINLATTIASGGTSLAGRAGLQGTAKAFNAAEKAVSAPMILEGGEKLINPHSTWGERGMGLAEIAGGIGGLTQTPTVRKPMETVDPNVEFMKVNSQRNQGMGQAIPPISPEVAGAKPVGKGTTAAVDAINVDNAAKIAEEVAANADYVDSYAKYRAAKVGTKFTLKPGEVNRKKFDDYIALGYNYKDMDASGNIIIEKIKDSPDIQQPKPNVNKDSKLLQAMNLPRSLMASIDFSAPLRQGIGLIHKKEFWTSLDDMFKAWGSEKAYNEIMSGITSDPLFKKNVSARGEIRPSFAEESGLMLSDLNSMTKREESMMSSWAEKVPGVRRSNRAYTAFLNKLRADTFRTLVDDAKIIGVDGKTNKPLANAMAEFVNTSTGRGSLGKLEPAAKILSAGLFSPRLIASRMQMMNPQYYWALPAPARKEALKSLFAIAAAGNTITTLGKMAGGTVEMDPASADFGKIKIGNTRIDPYAGFQQYIVAAQRLMPELDKLGLDFGGRMKSTNTGIKYSLSNPKYGQSERADVLERFAVGKANPIVGFAWQLMMRNERELSGEKMKFDTLNPMDNALSQRFIPLLIQDIYDMINEEGLQPKHAATIPLATFGMGVQQYKKERPR